MRPMGWVGPDNSFQPSEAIDKLIFRDSGNFTVINNGVPIHSVVLGVGDSLRGGRRSRSLFLGPDGIPHGPLRGTDHVPTHYTHEQTNPFDGQPAYARGTLWKTPDLERSLSR